MIELSHRIVSILQFALVIIIIIIIFMYIFNVSQGRKYSKEFENLYSKLKGEDSKYAAEAIKAADKEPLERRDAEYYYRRGIIYQHNLNDITAATACYNRALNLLQRENHRDNTFIFITDRIRDNAQLAGNWQLHAEANNIMNFIEGEDIAVQNLELFMAPFNNVSKPKIKAENTSAKANAIESVKTFKSDSQNVHDSSVTNDLKEQFDKIVNYNTEEGLNLSVESFKPSPERQKLISSAMDKIKSNFSKISTNGASEYDLLNAVWNRIHSKKNKHNYKELLNAFEEQLADCSSVCVIGRICRIMSSLAVLDADPSLGILRNKETLRNELLNDAAKIVETYTGKDAANSQAVIDYNAGVRNMGSEELENIMIERINGLAEKYSGKIPEDQLKILINQSIDVIRI